MKLGIDISQIVYKGTGVGRFTEGLINAICTYDKTNQWTFLFSSLRQSLDEKIIKRIKDQQHTLVSLPIPPTLLSFFWNSLHRLQIEKFTGQLDWFITSDWTEGPSTLKKATIVHDLVFMRYPETVDPLILRTQRKRLELVKKESQLIFTDSESTKNDLIDFLEIDPKKIVINYPGVDFDEPESSELGKIKQKYDLTRPFILSVGKLEPRKNIQTLIHVFDSLKLEDVDLVIVGQEGWGKLQPSQHSNVRMLGYVPDVDLYSLYASCLFFIFPSIWEGFGYPAIEAMRCGAPTALADTSSLKEIGEGASLLFDPHSATSIQKAIQKMVKDEDLRSQLRKKGLEKSHTYNWKNYYDTFISSL